MADLEVGNEVQEGLSVNIAVSELDGEYWSSVDLILPEPDENDEVDANQFLVLMQGIELAAEKVLELIRQLGLGDEYDGDI